MKLSTAFFLTEYVNAATKKGEITDNKMLGVASLLCYRDSNLESNQTTLWSFKLMQLRYIFANILYSLVFM